MVLDSSAVLIVTGLCMDICGVVILAGPLLKFTREKHSDILARYETALQDYSKYLKEFEKTHKKYGEQLKKRDEE